MIKIDNGWNKYADGQDDQSYESFFVEMTDCVRSTYDSACYVRTSVIYYSLILVISGCLQTDKGTLRAEKGELILMPKFSNDNINVVKKAETVKIVFNASKELFCIGKTPEKLTVTPDLADKIYRLYRTVKFNVSMVGLNEALLLDILNDVNKYKSSSSTELYLYEKLCRWIEENSDKAISPKDVANGLGYSREYLNRIVRAVDGETLNEKIALFRLERIKNLCSSEDMSLSDIAERLNFYSAELLCKYFKYHTGTSINQFRKSRL